MARVVPLTLRFVRSELTGEVPSPPHDSLTPAARREFIAAHPRSYLGVTRAPDDVDEEDEGAGDDVLAAGKRFLDQLLADDVFDPETDPAYFIYRLEQGDHCQTGLVCGVATADYDSGTVRVHERVRTERAGHLARHLRVVGAQSSPIALAFDALPMVTEIMAAVAGVDEPILDFSDDSGLRQVLWQITDPAQTAVIDGAFGDRPLYLIDGHHRAAAASADLAAHPDEASDEHLMLATVFPHEELRSHAFHRVLTDVDPVAIESDIAAGFATRSTADPAVVDARTDNEIALALPGAEVDDPPRWLLIDVPIDEHDAIGLGNIDPVRLSTHVLHPLLGIDESGADARLSYRPGTADRDEIASIRPRQGEVLFLMRAISTATLLAVSDAGLVMPPKSTYFQPKVRSGLFVRLID